MVREPRTLDEARSMLVAAMQHAIGGNQAMDIVVRARVRHVPVRQIAREDRIDRRTVGLRLRRWDAVTAAVEDARRNAGRPEGWMNGAKRR